jgi:large subunit ribosomal protein L4
MALLSRIRDEEALVVDGFKLDEIKTKAVAELLGSLDIDGVSCLIALGASDIDEDQTIYRSARNIRFVAVSPASQINAYAVLRPKCLLLTRAALEELCPNLNWKKA